MTIQLSQEEDFLFRAENLIEANLDNEQFGVNELSEGLGVSRSHLHRKLNALTGKSTSQFIREFRLEKAMVMLRDNVATASEIAYRVGFSSATYFNTCFSEYFGYPPGEVKYRSKIGDNIQNRENPKFKKDKKFFKKFNKDRLSIKTIGMIAVLVLALIFIVLYSPLWKADEPKNHNNEEKVDTERTIAVLPFKNLNNDADNQYFVDGMREDLINHLSKVESLLIKSRQSSDRYGTTELTGLEIGEALNVNYIIDGSVQKYDDRVKIIVNLIDSKKDSNLWSKDFDSDFEDIFELQSEISQLIANELNVVLSPDEIRQIRKIPTDNLEAYNLNLRGNYFLFDFSGNGFDLAEKYYNQSIAHDPGFALPYSGLAVLNLWRNWPRPSEEDYLKAKEYALKGIDLDPNLSRTHLSLALVYMEYEWNWEEAEKKFLKALSIDPNDPGALITYAKYLMYVKGNHFKARDYIDRALTISPLSYYFKVLSAENYLLNSQFELTIKEAQEAKEINKKNGWAPWILFLANIELGNYEIAVKELEDNWNLEPNFIQNVDPMLESYRREGIPGIFAWLNELDINHANEAHVHHNAYSIAQKFAFLAEYDKAIQWLNIAFNRKNSDLSRVKYDHFFKEMRTDPEFLALLDKMNLGDYSHIENFKD